MKSISSKCVEVVCRSGFRVRWLDLIWLQSAPSSLVLLHSIAIIAHHHLSKPAVQVVVPPLLQVHTTDAAEDVDVAQCTQIPMTNASTGFKRLRKERLSKVGADGGETTPKPQRRTSSRKVATAEYGLADMTFQTPMPESDAPNELGPPPPDSTPAPKHGNLAPLMHVHKKHIHRPSMDPMTRACP